MGNSNGKAERSAAEDEAERITRKKKRTVKSSQVSKCRNIRTVFFVYDYLYEQITRVAIAILNPIRNNLMNFTTKYKIVIV